MATIMEMPMPKGLLHLQDISTFIHTNVKNITVTVCLLSFGLFALHCIYNLYFHPLAKFPGPKLAAISPLWHSIQALSGRQVFRYRKTHEKYGPVVRIGPNELSFTSAAAWKDIHGHHPRKDTFYKTDFYNTDRKDYGTVNIVSAKDFDQHAEIRRLFAHSFSAKSLGEQEPIVDSYVNLFIQKIGRRYAGKERGPDGEFCNIVHWFNYTTFDIVGDLGFGSSAAFNCLRNERPHEWVTFMLTAIKAGNFKDTFRRYPFMQTIGWWLIPRGLAEVRGRVLAYAQTLVDKRMGEPSDRKDFFTNLLDKQEFINMHPQDVTGNAQVLVVAGSETTATALSGMTWLLCSSPGAYQKLKDEVRSSFKNYSEISNQAASRLPYLNAVIEEGLRLYPPVGIGMPRRSPGGMVAGYYIPPGVDVSVHSYSSGRNPDNFQRPDEFIPERWIDPAFKETDHKEGSQPFSLGPRGCLGRNLAYMELRTILAKMTWIYDVELVDKNINWIEANIVWTLWHKPPLEVKIRLRDGLPEEDKAFVISDATT